MGKLEIAIVSCILILLVVPRVDSTSKEIDQWLHKLPHAEEKVTHLHFYFHDIISGPNPSAMRVAQSNITDKSSTFFGLVMMIDDPLTEGPEPTSKEVGRAQGFYGSAAQESAALLMSMNLIFTTGKFNGSTLAVLGPKSSTRTPTRVADRWRDWCFPIGTGICFPKNLSFQCNYW